VLYSISYIFVSNDEKNRTNIELVNALETTSVEYRLIYNIYKKNSKLIFKQFINKPKILQIIADINASNKNLQRKKLYNATKADYILAKKLGIKQLQFYLLNNESFLRMHAPEKFGDNLSKIRYSVKYVNSVHKPISGFEQGKIIHGFRFVYPLSQNKKYIGSVEVSIDANTFKTIFENTLYIDAYFLLDKKIATKKLFKEEIYKHYDDSLDSPQYLQTKFDEHGAGLKSYMQQHLKEYQALLSPKLKSKKAFSIEIVTKSEHYIKVFIPVKNIEEKKVVAYFVANMNNQNLKHIHNDAFNVKIALFFFFLLIMYVIHKNLMYGYALRATIKKKTQELEASEKQVIEAEKMASLGTLVAGIAHEINTPVGLSITAMSNFIEQTKTLKEDYDKEEMDQDQFEKYLNKTIITTDLVFSNLVKTANLIKDFKQIAINDTDDSKKEINLNNHIQNIIETFKKLLQDKSVDVILNIDKRININTYADTLTTVISNLLQNSIVHAFNNKKDAKISISITKKSKKTTIIYSDNGCGMSDEQIDNVYEPFYTTNRGSGGSGLGMHIVFNLITQKLGGTINLESVINYGVQYTIII
jgi:signal transduction histidine kinase